MLNNFMLHKFLKGILCTKLNGWCYERGGVPKEVSCLFPSLEPTDKLWIGLNDRKVPMYFEWSDGTPVTYTKWHLGEPSTTNNRPEDCVLIKGQVTLLNTDRISILRLTI